MYLNLICQRKPPHHQKNQILTAIQAKFIKVMDHNLVTRQRYKFSVTHIHIRIAKAI